MQDAIVNDYLSRFDPGSHVVLLYNDQKSKDVLLFTHLKYGEHSQGLAYVCSEESPSLIRQEMQKFGLDTNSVKGTDKLTISNYDEIYIVNGEVDIPAIIGKFAGMVDACRNRGLNGLRAAAEMSCFFKHGKIEELVAYERALHRRLMFKAEGICAYNITEISSQGYLDVVMPLVRAHDPVIFATPNGYLIMKPSKVGNKHIEQMTSQFSN